MYVKDHAPPPFHAIYGEHEASVEIETGDVIDGRLPKRAARLVREWVDLNREGLMENWRLIAEKEQPIKIAGLDVE